jgi:hypothetical protein
MKNILISSFIFIISFSAFSQTSDYWPNWHQVKIGYGVLNLNREFYKNPLEIISDSKFKKSMEVITLEGSVKHNIEVNRTMEFGFLYYLPQTMELSDSLSAKRTGYNTYVIFKYDLLPKTKIIDLFVGGGVSLGRHYLYINDGNSSSYRNYNASVLPQIDLEIRPLKRLAFSAEANFLSDLTFQKWKSKNPAYLIAPTRFGGTLLRFSVSFFYR